MPTTFLALGLRSRPRPDGLAPGRGAYQQQINRAGNRAQHRADIVRNNCPSALSSTGWVAPLGSTIICTRKQTRVGEEVMDSLLKSSPVDAIKGF